MTIFPLSPPAAIICPSGENATHFNFPIRQA
jgi:hypothetical protein